MPRLSLALPEESRRTPCFAFLPVGCVGVRVVYVEVHIAAEWKSLQLQEFEIPFIIEENNNKAVTQAGKSLQKLIARSNISLHHASTNDCTIDPTEFGEGLTPDTKH